MIVRRIALLIVLATSRRAARRRRSRRAAPPTRAPPHTLPRARRYVPPADRRPAHFPDGWRFRAGRAPVRGEARDGRERRTDREPRRRRDHAARRQCGGRRGRRRRSRSPSCIPRRATSAAADSWSSAWPTAATRRSTIARSRRSPRRATCTSTPTGKLDGQERRRSARVGRSRRGGRPHRGARASYGTMSLARRHAPAIRLAEEGFVVDSAFAQRSRDYREAHRQVRRRRGVPPERQAARAGHALKQPALARTLRAIAAQRAHGVLRGRRSPRRG